MEQNAKQLLGRISDKIGTLTDKEISRVSHAQNEKEWRAYIGQKEPYWEDIAWRVKEPNAKGEAEVHLGFYSAKPSEALNNAIEKAEALAKGKVNHVVKNENGIRLVWKENLNDIAALDKLYLHLEGILNEFLGFAFGALFIPCQLTNQFPNKEIENEDKPQFTLCVNVFLSGFEKEDYEYLKEDSNEITSIKDQIEEVFNYSKMIRTEDDYPVYNLVMPSDEDIEAEGVVIYEFISLIPLNSQVNNFLQDIKDFTCELSFKNSTLVRVYIIPKNIEEVEKIDFQDWGEYLLQNNISLYSFRDGYED